MPSSLVMGSRGPEVAQMQAALNVRRPELPLLAMDGMFGPKTLQRVLAFQRANRLLPDGILGPNTRAKLFAFSWVVPPQGGTPIFLGMPPSHAQLVHVITEIAVSTILPPSLGSDLNGANAAQISAWAHRILLFLPGVHGQKGKKGI
jgi:hypothetical protein